MQHLLDWTLRCTFDVYCLMRVSVVMDMAYLHRLFQKTYPKSLAISFKKS